MKLTGKANLEFIKWYQKNIDTHKLSAVQFRNMPNNVKWGVLQDFFDSTEIDTDYLFENEIYIQLSKNDGKGSVGDFRVTARKYAIERANELYNNAK